MGGVHCADCRWHRPGSVCVNDVYLSGKAGSRGNCCTEWEAREP